MRGVLPLAVELWTFGSPGRLPTSNFSKCWASPPHLAKVGLRQLCPWPWRTCPLHNIKTPYGMHTHEVVVTNLRWNNLMLANVISLGVLFAHCSSFLSLVSPVLCFFLLHLSKHLLGMVFWASCFFLYYSILSFHHSACLVIFFFHFTANCINLH